MALLALADLHGVKGRLVHAGLKELGLPDVALSTNVGDRGESGRSCAVIAMATVAGWSRQVLPFIQGTGMDAGLVISELIVGNAVASHILGVGVALATSVSDVQGIDQGLGVLYAPDTMNSVAAYAGGDFLVAGFEQLAVHARQVLLLLVYAKTRIEFLHEVGIAVALSAEIRNVFRGRLADKTLSLVHSACGIVLGWVSAVAARTREAPAEMNIVLGVSDWFQQLALHLGVAFDAGIFLLAVTQSEQAQGKEGQDD